MSALSGAIARQSIAEGTMGKSRVRDGLRVTFDTARARYVTASQEMVDILATQGEQRVTIDHLNAALEGIEAGWIRTGELEGLNNDLLRKAKIQTLRDTSSPYIAVVSQVMDAKREMLTVIEPAIERVKLELRMCRLDMEMSIAEVRCLAGEDER